LVVRQARGTIARVVYPVDVHQSLATGVEVLMDVPMSSGGKGGPDDAPVTIRDNSGIPPEPSADLEYRHHARLKISLTELWESRDIVFTLAERDFRAQYKQATLGVLWALLAPMAMLFIFTIIFSRTKVYGIPGVPYPIFAYIGIICWTFFSQSLNTGGNSLLSNNALLSKTQFPRECFPLETILVTALNTVLSWIPLVLLFFIYGIVPSLHSVWVPLLMVIELVFTIGLTVGVSAMIIQMRDLAQVLPIVISLGLFATPVIWQFNEIPKKFQLIYGFVNPLGPVIDDARRTILLGLNPSFGPLAMAALGAAFYMVVGYRLFKRFEVNFADIA
jgi:ABC-type polysaccharide/polyol phosphate export permease